MSEVRPLNILVVGAGMYACGRGTDGYGTVLPALYQAKREQLAGSARIAAQNAANQAVLKEKTEKLDGMFGLTLVEGFYPRAGKDPQAYRQALQEGWKPDCAIVCVPDHLHFAITSDLVKRGIHCLVVKPLAPTVAEVEALARLADDHNVYGAVEFHKRYDHSNLKLREAIRQGLVGDPLYFIVEYSQRKSIPLEIFKGWVGHTHILQYLGIHYIDIIYFATGACPRRVMAVGQKNFLRSQGIDNYDAIQCLIEWESANGSRFLSAIHTNWIDPEGTSAMSDQRIKVIGTKGRYEADQKRRGVALVTDQRGLEEPNHYFSSFIESGSGEGVSFQGYGAQSILQFLRDVRDIKGGALIPRDLEGRRPTFRESLVPTAVLEAATRSLEAEGLWVECR